MSISALRSARCIFSVMAVTVFSALLLVGCGKDDDDGGSDSLVCGAGEAWTGMSEGCDYDEGEVCYFGYIFQKNNDFLAVSNKDGQWYVWWTAKWSTSGNELTFVGEDGGEGIKATYAISGNTLTITIFEEYGGGSMTFTKSSGINPVFPPTP